MSTDIRHVSEATFDTEVLQSPVPVLVDYWAEWCTPCRMISPLIDELARDYAGRLEVAKVDIDENPQLPSRYHVRSIPTLMLFRDGRPVATSTGAVNRSQLAAFVEAGLREAGPAAEPASQSSAGTRNAISSPG